MIKEDILTKNILLIGTSQSGKSTLGNYLLDPINFNEQFIRGNSLKSETVDVQEYSITLDSDELKFENDENSTSFLKKYFHSGVNKIKFNIIDTPGIGDSNSKDEDEKITNLYKYLLNKYHAKNNFINTLLLVIRYDTLLSEEFYTNLEFYKRMFGDLFLNNLILIITSYKQGENWIREQQIEKKCLPEHILNKILQDIKDNLKINELIHYTINSLPMYSDDIEYSKQIRKMLFLSTLTQMNVSIKKLKLPKLERWNILDKERIKGYEGNIEGFNIFINKINQEQTVIKEEIGDIINQITKVNTQINKYNNKFNEYNNDEEVIQYIEKIKKDREFYDLLTFWISNHIDINTPHEITRYEVLQGANELNIVGNKLIGVVYGYFYRGIDCYIRIFTQNKYKYSNVIPKIKRKLDISNVKREYLEKDYNKYLANEREFVKQINNYKLEIEHIQDEINLLKSQYTDINKVKNYMI